MRAYYSDKVLNFLITSDNEILGQMLMKHKFSNDQEQKNAWAEQIKILKFALKDFPDGTIYFEFAIPRMGKRVDNILVLNGIIYVLEFKVYFRQYDNYAIDQAVDYALDLKNFHSESHNKPIMPILVATEGENLAETVAFYKDGVASCINTNKNNLGAIISKINEKYARESFDAEIWEKSSYKPTPTIVEAAKSLYSNHSVKDITRRSADDKNLTITTKAIEHVIKHSKQNNRKSICFITGVPGAGKTLAGLDIATQSMNYEDDEHAVFLSGNGPLVFVLREALIRDKSQRENIPKTKIEKEVYAFIQNIHHFRDEYFQDPNAPVEKVVIFDEAQRAWDKEQASKFMTKKNKIADFDFSEPEFLINVMNRHQDWCVIICLIGSGQEINTGEAGLSEWFRCLKNKYISWDVYCAPNLEEAASVSVNSSSDLHLSVSIRSFRSERLSEFVHNVVENNTDEARKIFSGLEDNYPVFLTRDLAQAKSWIKQKARGSERYGMVASSNGLRLRPEGVHVKNDIDCKNWFLNYKDDVRSCYALEEVATEFDVQGLELDWALVCWDANYRRENNNWAHYTFRGTKWQNINKKEDQRYLLNSYRVLLTRARQGMIIFVPEGSPDDKTRLPSFYDGIYEYLKSCGIKELEWKQEEIFASILH